MTPQQHILERLQRATRAFAFEHRVPAIDDEVPVTLRAAAALAQPTAPIRAHAFPVRAGTFTPFRFKEAA